MVTFKDFVAEATFNVNSSRSNTLPSNRTSQPTYPLQTGVSYAPRAPAQPAAPSQPTYPAQITPPTTQTVAPVPPAVTTVNAPSVTRNGQLSPQELKPVGKYNAGPSGMRQWYRNNAYLSPRAADAFIAAQQAYGSPIPINSAYRSLEHQKGLSGEGHKVVGQAGRSRHGLGMAVDIQPNTPHYNWFKLNGPQFGWHYAAIAGDPYHFEFRG